MKEEVGKQRKEGVGKGREGRKWEEGKRKKKGMERKGGKGSEGLS